MKRILAVLTGAILALGMGAANASAYLHMTPAADACRNAVYPSAAANLRPYGIQFFTYGWTRSTDTSMQVRVNAFANRMTFLGGDGLTYFYTDLLACRVVGNDPGTVTTISDWGTTWRNTYQLG